MVSLRKFVPSQSDCQWLELTMDLVIDGGTWVAPASGMVLQVWKGTKQYKVIFEGSDGGECLRRTRIVFKAIGWEVQDERTTG